MPITDWTDERLKFTWIDILNPTEEELKQISDKYNLHNYTLRDCLDPGHLPKHEDLGDTHFIITRLLTNTQAHKVRSIQQFSSKLALFYNEDYLITVHRLELPFLGIIKDKYITSLRVKDTYELVTKIIWYVLYTYDKPALDLSLEVDAYEEKIFLHNLTPKMMEDLYYIKRRADICNKLLVLTGEVINTIPVSKRDAVAFQDVQDLHVKLRSLYTQLHDDVSGLLNIYLSLSSQKTNEVMKVLTIFSAFFLPLTFIVGIYGMNFKYMPELEKTWGYPGAVILMGLISVFIYIWFKKKKWL